MTVFNVMEQANMALTRINPALIAEVKKLKNVLCVSEQAEKIN